MRELVIVICDLYLPAEATGTAALSLLAPLPAGLAFLARFGAREPLAHGWRAWLAGWLGGADFAGIAPARIAAAPYAHLAAQDGTLWIASPVHLSAGLSGVHLDHRGLLQLDPGELTDLGEDFRRAFAGSGFTLTPASPQELLLLTPGVAAVASAEPSRYAGREVNEALPRGPAAAGLRRTWAEMEMWLHAQPANQARARRGAPTVSALWPWGAHGSTALPTSVPAAGHTAAFATDAYVRGLWHLHGLTSQAVPQEFGALPATTGAQRAVLVVAAGAQLQDPQLGFGAALAQLDARYVSPALQAVRRGEVHLLRLVANDRCLSVHRGSHLKIWRRAHAARGLA